MHVENNNCDADAAKRKLRTSCSLSVFLRSNLIYLGLLYYKSTFYDQINVTSNLIDTRIIANIRYFPSSGTTNDVGGIISTTRRKNT